MKVMVIVKASPSSEAGETPSQQLFTEMGKYNEELVKAGIMQTGAGLHPSSKAVRVRFSGKNRVVTDGPFAETRELIAGFWIWKVSSMAEAIEWVKRCPNPMNEESDIDIRPIFEAEDFGEALTPELREQEASIRAQALGLGAPRFENGREMVIAGLNEHYTHETRVNIPKQWERFVPHLGKIAGQVGGSSYGVVWRTTPDFSFEYLCGVEVQSTDKLPSGFTHVKLTTQRYAVSLGGFPTEEAAKSRLGEVLARGASTARVGPRQQVIALTTLVVRDPQAPLIAKVRDLAPQYSGSDAKVGNCEKT